MNPLIPGAKFSKRAATEQRLKAALRGEKRTGEPDDLTDHSRDDERIVEGFRKHDPAKQKLAQLFKKAKPV